MIKILAIGNSFSQDATRYIEDIAKSAGQELFVRNLYIGGCSLERHAENVRSGEEAYAYQKDAQMIEMISVTDALRREDWDYVTVQQVSGKSGLMLVTGDMDNNVNPANTIRVINALIRANKRFDILLLPGQRHSFSDMDEYFFWKMADHFSRYLLGESKTETDIKEINND